MNTGKSRDLGKATAEAIAAQALGFIAGDSARLGRFLAESGLGPDNIRQAATDPAFLPAVLDFILAHEADLLDFAAQLGIDPKHIGAARRLLPGAKFESS
jgi:Protein of unknown function (DUF3572)